MDQAKSRGWAGRTFLAIYVLGYVGFIVMAGAATWSEMGWYQWWGYMAFQVMYATFWPLWVALQLAGVR